MKSMLKNNDRKNKTLLSNNDDNTYGAKSDHMLS